MIREPLFCCHDCCQKQRATTRRNLEIANLRNSTSARRQVRLPPMSDVRLVTTQKMARAATNSVCEIQ